MRILDPVRAVAVAAFTAGVIVAAPQLSTAASSVPVPTQFGTLNTSADHALAEAQSGLRVATVEVSWARAEPQQGSFDDTYLASIAQWAAQLRADGDTLTLSLGLHYTPDWVLSLSDGRYVDEQGDTSDEADFVFSQQVRDAADAYIAHLGSVLPLSGFAGARVTSGGDAELLYPLGGHYWAFSSGAQNGQDAPASLPPNPLPGWDPGTSGESSSQVQSWLRWYVDGLDDAARWEMSTLRSAGFAGHFDVLTPGSGVRPDGVAPLVAANLPDGLAGVGAVWQWVYSDLGSQYPVEAYVSSVGDGSGGDDSCQPTDVAVPVASSVADSWSATRWIARLAAANGDTVGGESPGYDPTNGAAHYTDGSATGLAATAVRQARSCGFADFYWAHDNEFWDGVMPLSSYTLWVSGPAAPLGPAVTATMAASSLVVAATRSALTVTAASPHHSRPTGTVKVIVGKWSARIKLVGGKAVVRHRFSNGNVVLVSYSGDRAHRATHRAVRLARLRR